MRVQQHRNYVLVLRVLADNPRQLHPEIALVSEHRSSIFPSHPYLLLTLTVLFWSGNMVVRTRIAGVGPSVFAGFWALDPCFPADPAFWVATPTNVERAESPAMDNLLVLGALGVGAYNTLAYVALAHTTATNAALLNSFIPIAIIAISWFFGHRAKGLELVGVGISFCGVLTIISRGDPAILAGLSLNVGDVWMLVAVLSWALYTLACAGVPPLCIRWPCWRL